LAHADDNPEEWLTTSAELISLVLVESATYGPPFKRDQKIVSGINRFIASQGADLPVNLFEGSDHLVHATVRAAALGLLFGLARHRETFPVSRRLEAGANPTTFEYTTTVVFTRNSTF
jgi:hypothetical protein